MKTRIEILNEAKRISADIAQIKIDAEYWNANVRKPTEAPIDWNPLGEMANLAAPLDEMIAREELWHVYKLNDCDWWLARSLQEAKNAAIEHYGGPEFADDMIENGARRLSQIELHTTMFCVDAERGPNARKITFRQELDNRLKAGPKVELFASTEF